PWTSHAGLTTSRPFRRPRSVLPHRESVHVALDGLPSRVRPVLSWASSPLQSLAPAVTSSPSNVLTRHRGAVAPRVVRVSLAAHVTTIGTTRAHLSWLAPRARSRATLDAGWILAWTTEASLRGPSADTRLVTTW